MKTLALILKSLVLVAVFTAPSGVMFAATRPNVVIFLADDSGWGDYSISGNRQVRTPNIDSIARGGATLDRFRSRTPVRPSNWNSTAGNFPARSRPAGIRPSTRIKTPSRARPVNRR